MKAIFVMLAVLGVAFASASCAEARKSVADRNACTKNADCGANEFCLMDRACGGTGACESIPEICTEQYVPVVGCNGKTYSNACRAHASGTSVKERADTK